MVFMRFGAVKQGGLCFTASLFFASKEWNIIMKKQSLGRILIVKIEYLYKIVIYKEGYD